MTDAKADTAPGGIYHYEPKRRSRLPFWLKTVLRVLLVLIVAVPVYLVTGMIALYRVGDTFAELTPPEQRLQGGSYTVQLIADVLERETIVHEWLANDPWFSPGAWLDNPLEFQRGLYQRLGVVMLNLENELSRQGGADEAVPQLRQAREQLSYGSDHWIVGGWLTPQDSTERRNRQAIAALRSYNQELASGTKRLVCRSGSLHAVLNIQRIGLGNIAARAEAVIESPTFWLFDVDSDNTFYRLKGDLFGILLTLRGLHEDCLSVINAANAEGVWQDMMDSLGQANAISPLVVTNSDSGGFFWNNHLVAFGFHVSRAMSQMERILNEMLVF